MQKLARIISILFIPPTFTLIAFIYLAIEFENQFSNKIYVFVIAFIFGVISQIASFIYFRNRGMISDIDVRNRAERDIPYLISTLIYLAGFILLLIGNVSVVSIAFWFCYISNTVLVIFINKFFKISIHAMGAAGPLALLTFIAGIDTMMLLPILIIIGWSRIKLKVHSLNEVITGAFLGFASVYFQLTLLLTKY